MSKMNILFEDCKKWLVWQNKLDEDCSPHTRRPTPRQDLYQQAYPRFFIGSRGWIREFSKRGTDRGRLSGDPRRRNKLLPPSCLYTVMVEAIIYTNCSDLLSIFQLKLHNVNVRFI